MKQEMKYCEHCGSSLKEYWHSLSTGLVTTLIKFAREIKRKGENNLHITTEGNFTTNQICNFQKLKYFGLVAKLDSGESAGYWVLTTKGLDFVNNRISVNKKIKTFRGQIVDRSEEMVGTLRAMLQLIQFKS